MTELAEVALAFCRQCLGWEGAYSTSAGYIIQREGKAPCYGTVLNKLNANDLNAVMTAVRNWHRKHKLFVSLYSYPEVDVYCAAVFNHEFMLDCEHVDPCQALLEACLQAHRELKALV